MTAAVAEVSGSDPFARSARSSRSTARASPVGGTTWRRPMASGRSGLRRALPAGAGRELPSWTYDEQQQKAVDSSGCPLIQLPIMGDPSADTTSTTDGEDGPSSEDWNND